MIRLNTLKLVCLGSLLASSIVHAAPACDGFQVKVRNSLPGSLVISKAELVNAQIQPSGAHELPTSGEQVFKVSGSNDNLPMSGTITFRSVKDPSKEINIAFNLMNNGNECGFADYTPASDYTINMAGSKGEIFYNILARQ